MILKNELPKHYCEIDYIENIIKILEDKLPNNLELYILNNDFNLPITLNNNTKVGIHIGNEVGWDTKNYDKLDIIFRFYQSEKCDNIKIFPINIGYNSSGNNQIYFISLKNINERSIDVFFKGQSTHRNNFFNNLALKKYKKNIVKTTGFRQGDTIEDYLETLSNSKICLVPKGLSSETFRYTEAFASGCIVITTEKISTWFYENSPAFFVQNWNEVNDEFIDKILELDLLIEKEKSLNYYQKYLSPQANANYILKILSEKKII
jgi:hypothetical protein